MPTHKTAHLQTAQADTMPKFCKRAVFFANAPNGIIKFDFLKLNIK